MAVFIIIDGVVVDVYIVRTGWISFGAIVVRCRARICSSGIAGIVIGLIAFLLIFGVVWTFGTVSLIISFLF